jgi:gamma-butyrobetaine dioxygenase
MTRVQVVSGDLLLTGPRGGLRFPAVWLRDNCPGPECRDPGSGQKLFGITDIPNETVVTAAEQTPESVTVTYGPDGHRSTFARSWLAEHALGGVDPPDDRAENSKRLWLAADLDGGLPRGSWPAYRDDPGHRAACLRSVLRDGFVMLGGVPDGDGMVAAVAGCFGFVRETNYGRVFDVRVEAAPSNLASTGRALLPHTDNPYRDPVPTVQLLHCRASAAEGGDTRLVDGFRAAALLREEDPGSFRVLAGTPVSFGFDDPGTALRACQPLIGLGPRGRIRGVRFNNRSTQALRGPYEEVVAFYAAYRRWAQVLARPELAVTMRLEPGDCLIMDNTRILHGRTAFTGAGRRHLQGCYADLDSLASSLAVLERAEEAA